MKKVENTSKFISEVKALEKNGHKGCNFYTLLYYNEKSKGRGDNKQTRKTLTVHGGEFGIDHHAQYQRAGINHAIGTTYGTHLSALLVEHKEKILFHVNSRRKKSLWNNGVTLPLTENEKKRLEFRASTGIAPTKLTPAKVVMISMNGERIINMEAVKEYGLNSLVNRLYK